MNQSTDQPHVPIRPTTTDLDAWSTYRNAWLSYWRAQDQPWRTEPEIDPKRQAELEWRRMISPDLERGIYPFKGMKLTRADVEWLLATHDIGREPVDWSNEQQKERQELDLRGADLRQADLHDLPLTCLRGGLTLDESRKATEEQLTWAAVLMQEANLSNAQLEQANLSNAQLEQANLSNAQLSGADLSEAQLTGANLSEAQLTGANLSEAQLSGADLSEAQLMRAHLYRAQLTGANLSEAQLSGADLSEAQLMRARLYRAQLAGARLYNAQLGQADLREVRLEQADLRGAQLQQTDLRKAELADQNHVGPRLVDTRWSDTNLVVVDWSRIRMLGDELEAQQQRSASGLTKDRGTRLQEYRLAIYANRQLAAALHAQGLNEDAARFTYRAQRLQQAVLRLQRKFIQYLFSLFLDTLSGYGYRPVRAVLWYLLIVGGFATVYSILGHLSFIPDALVFSLTSFHGRGFFPGLSGETSLHNPLVVLASLEAVLGLLIEISFIATFTQRFFGK